MRLFSVPALLVAAALCCPAPASAQTPSDLNATLAQLQTLLAKDIVTARNTYAQKLEFDPAQPYRVTIGVTQTNEKGKATETRYALNLGSLDKYTVRVETSKDELSVPMRTAKNQNVVKVVRDGVQQSFTNALTLRAADIEQARELEKLLEAAIPAADAAWQASIRLHGDLPGLLTDLQTYVGNVELDGKTTRQQLSADAAMPDVLTLDVEDGTSAGGFTTRFSVGDLQAAALEVRVSGKKITLAAKTKRGLRFIRTQGKKETTHSFDNDVQFVFDDPDRAFAAQRILEKMIGLGEKALEARLPQPKTREEALALLAKTLTSFSVGPTEYQQTFNAQGPMLLYTRQKSTDAQETRYELNLGDLNDRDVELTVSGKVLELEVKTADQQRFVKVLKNNQLDRFDTRLSFVADDVEKARLVDHVLPLAIGYCKTTVTPEKMDWAVALLAKQDLQGVRQELTREGAEACKFSFKRLTETSSKTNEQLYEFNLSDLNSRAVAINVTGKKLTVSAPTKGREKVIKYYENGKPAFASDLSFEVADIDAAKKLRATLRAAIEECK